MIEKKETGEHSQHLVVVAGEATVLLHIAASTPCSKNLSRCSAAILTLLTPHPSNHC